MNQVGEDVESLSKKGFSQLESGLFEDSIETFSLCLQMELEQAGLYSGRARARFQLKDWASAASDFDRARQLDPNSLEDWVGFGMSLAMGYKIYEAIDVFETLLTQHPNYVQGHVQLGALYFKIGAIAQGRREMEKACASRPTLAQRQMVEQILKEQNQLDKRRYYRPDFEELRRERST